MDLVVNVKKIENSAKKMENVKKSIESCNKRLENVKNEIIWKNGSYHTLGEKIGQEVTATGQMITKTNGLGLLLNEVAKSYRNAEVLILAFKVALNEAILRESRGNNPLGNVSKEDRNSYVEDYERLHPDTAQDINNLLREGVGNQITEEDMNNIKYLIYTAGEPYRTIFISSLTFLAIGTMNENGRAWYSPVDQSTHYTYEADFGEDPRGPYTTFFHENGHAIDDLSDLTKITGSDTENYIQYSDTLGRNITFREAIEYDVYYNKNNPHSITSVADQIKASGKSGSNGNVDNVVKAFQKGDPSGLGKEDLKLYNAVKNQAVNMGNHPHENYEAVTDVYGGVTGNELRSGGYGHEKKYWDNKTMPAKELWAEFFAYQMAGDQAALNNVYEYFPEASKLLEGYANQLVK